MDGLRSILAIEALEGSMDRGGHSGVAPCAALKSPKFKKKVLGVQYSKVDGS
jgi:hypothetical protein